MIKYFIFLLILQSCQITKSYSKSVIRRLPGYPEDLPFKLETGYIGVGEKEDVQLFYYFIESTRNPKDDSLIFYIPGGPGASALAAVLHGMGPLDFNLDDLTLTLNPNTWTQMANFLSVDIPAGTGFSYLETKEGWISSDNILAVQAVDFIKKFVSDHPKFLRNPIYIAGTSYMGIIVPKITLELYEGNERGDQPTLNIQGYMLTSPFTNKFMDFNSRLEYAHRVALVSDNIYQSAVNNCHGNYVYISFANSACLKSLQSYEEKFQLAVHTPY
ncbi:serine carboxypeptidase-like 18 isoform X2 [Helianthus annuus]|uniref:serine carboxypeptidase-like 18 isoform X2 n=1 Tax=Helianthus annuus TaxID=4232 RepID=UPI001652BF96|nr:serine carboxypeptidase-like 18 isoform X2 [Helianthus annuus]